MIKVLTILIGVLGTQHSFAMPTKTQILKSRAFYQEAEGGLLEALDLKRKTMRMTQTEAALCKEGLRRMGQTLSYSCTIDLPSQAAISKLRRQVSSSVIEVPFLQAKRKVFITVSEDAREVTYTTSFDKTGLDLDVAKMNADLLPLHTHVAGEMLAQAMFAAPLSIEILESR